MMIPHSHKKISLFLRRCLALALCCAPLCAWAVDYDPRADEAAVVTSGNARFTVLTARMVRIQYSAKAQFEDRSTLGVVNRHLPVPHFTVERDGGLLTIRTDSLTLTYREGTTPQQWDGKPANLQATFRMGGQEVVWYAGKSDALNLLGTNRTLDTAWGDNARHKLEKGLLSREGWSVIDESPATKRGDGSTTYALEPIEDGLHWWAEPLDKQATDWYLLAYGHDYKTCLMDYMRIGGRVPLPPKYIFGYWYSRYWAYKTADFQQIVRDVENNLIPMDVLIMDMDWHKSGWTGWSWNKSLIPNPTYLMRYMHQHGLRTALNLHPADGVGSHEDYYAAMKEDLGLPASSTDRIPWAIEDYKFAKSFFSRIIRDHESEGVDFWWLDWQQHLLVDGMTLGETYWCTHTFFEDMEAHRPELRPVTYHRWGGLGSHRYPICFSGDTWAAWSTLGYEIVFTSTASNVLYAYWGHDLGGHQGGNNDPELLQRWLQFGAYTPIFRTHATNDSKLERRIWKYPNFVQLRETIRERYRMFPYIYTCARETYDKGLGMNRPLYYDYPEAAQAYQWEDEYMFGPSMLVAPIYTPVEGQYAVRNIWLPEGRWWDVTRRKLRTGDQTLAQRFTLDEFPVFYRAGSVIPFYPVQRTTVTTPREIILKVVPGADGEGSFYEDDGANNEYTRGEWATTRFTQTRTAEAITLCIHARQGTYKGIPTDRQWTIQLLGTEAPVRSADVTIDGQPIPDGQLSYDEAQHMLTILIPEADLTRDQVVRIAAPQADAPHIDPNGEGDLQIETDDETAILTLLPTGEEATLSILTLDGRQLRHVSGKDVQRLSQTMTGLPRGTYIVRAQQGLRVLTRKVTR